MLLDKPWERQCCVGHKSQVTHRETEAYGLLRSWIERGRQQWLCSRPLTSRCVPSRHVDESATRREGCPKCRHCHRLSQRGHGPTSNLDLSALPQAGIPRSQLVDRRTTSCRAQAAATPQSCLSRCLSATSSIVL